MGRLIWSLHQHVRMTQLVAPMIVTAVHVTVYSKHVAAKALSHFICRSKPIRLVLAAAWVEAEIGVG